MAATTAGKAQCISCGKERSAVRCEGCLQFYCYHHLADHRQDLNKQFDEIEVDRDQFRDTLTRQTNNLEKHASIQQIDQWKEDSTKKVEQTAEERKQLFLQDTTELIADVEVNLNKFTDELRRARQEDDFNEIDLNRFIEQLNQLKKELEQSPIISIQEDSASPVSKISVLTRSSSECIRSERKPTSDELLNEIEVLRTQLNETYNNQQKYEVLKASFVALDKRCVKHQKSEIEAKRQLTVYQEFIDNLQRENTDLTKRLGEGIEVYKVLYRKYVALENITDVKHKEGKSATKTNSLPTLPNDEEAQQCPLCSWEFPIGMTLAGKEEHIESHFE